MSCPAHRKKDALSKNQTRQCKVCHETKSKSYANFPRHGAGQLQTCRSCWTASRSTASVTTPASPDANERQGLERDDALVFAISKLITLQNQVTTHFYEQQHLADKLRQAEIQLATVREELDMAKLEIEELEQKLQKASTKTALVGLTPAERATLADFGYRPAVV